MMYGLITLLSMVAFVAVVVWAWSGARRNTYDFASRMPLEEEPPRAPDTPGSTADRWARSAGRSELDELPSAGTRGVQL